MKIYVLDRDRNISGLICNVSGKVWNRGAVEATEIYPLLLKLTIDARKTRCANIL